MGKMTVIKTPQEEVGRRFPQESALRQEGGSRDPSSQPVPHLSQRGVGWGLSREACSVRDSHTAA